MMMTPRVQGRNFNCISSKEIAGNTTLEPYTSPGDYDVPKLMGNKSILLSSIKTPPQFSFQKQSRNLEAPPNLALLEANMTQILNKDGKLSSRGNNENQTLNLFHSLSRKYKTFLSPGVGEY